MIIEKSHTSSLLYLLPAILLIVALLPLPYGYYQILRLVVTITAGYIAFFEYSKHNELNRVVVAFGIIALLFNPIITVHLTRELWAITDLIVSGLYIWQWRKVVGGRRA